MYILWLFNHSLTEGRFDCVQYLAVTNKAAFYFRPPYIIMSELIFYKQHIVHHFFIHFVNLFQLADLDHLHLIMNMVVNTHFTLFSISFICSLFPSFFWVIYTYFRFPFLLILNVFEYISFNRFYWLI